MALLNCVQPEFEQFLKHKEEELVTRLKKVCDDKGRETDLKESAQIFHELGLVFKERDSDKVCLIQSAALLVAARLRNPEESDALKNDLEGLWKMILCKATSNKDIDVKLNDITKTVQRIVTEMRHSVKKDLDDIPILNDNALNYDVIIQQEKHKIRCIENLQEKVTAEYKSLMRYISSICVDILGNDSPTCAFALIGMGSLARREITPYSDFECIIILEEGIQSTPNYEDVLEHYRWVAVIFQIILISLGETILPSVAIPSLNNFHVRGGDWFYDDITPSGISFDGLMPYACKTPLGRTQATSDKPWKTELIKPVNEMLKYLSTEEDLKNGYHLADILTQTCFVFGDESVYNEFAEGVKSKMTEQRQNEEEFFARLDYQRLEDATKFDAIVDLFFLDFLPTDANLKRVFYRGLTIFISAWAKFHGFESFSSFQVVDRLHHIGYLSEVDQHFLKFGLAIACELRLKFYAQSEKQTETLKIHPTTGALSVQDLFDFVGKKCIVAFFSIANTVQNTKFEFNRKNLSLIYESKANSTANFEILVISSSYKLDKEILSVCKTYMHMFKQASTTRLQASAWFFIGMCLLQLKNSHVKAKKSFVKCIRELMTEENTKSCNFNNCCLKIYGTCTEYVNFVLTLVEDISKHAGSGDCVEKIAGKYSSLSKVCKFFERCRSRNYAINCKDLLSRIMTIFFRIQRFSLMLKELELETKEDLAGMEDCFNLE